MAGIGKSVVASALAHDIDIRRAFPDGVIWVTLGQNPDIILLQSQIAYILNDDPALFDNEKQFQSYLGKQLSDKVCLLVLDDVWRISDSSIFEILNADSHLLITTRNEKIAIGMGVKNYTLRLLEPDQALDLLRKSSEFSEEVDLPIEAISITKECGYLPLAIAMIGSMLRNRPTDRWQHVLLRLQDADIQKIRFEFSNYKYPDLYKALHVSVMELEPEIQKLYIDMAIFIEDFYVPDDVFNIYWSESEKLDYTPFEIIDLFIDRSLAFRGFSGGITLHDLQFDYVRKTASDYLSSLHKKIITRYSSKLTNGWSSVPDDGYFRRFLIYHLLKAGENQEAKNAAKDLLLNCTDILPGIAARYLKLLGKDSKKVAKELLYKKTTHHSIKGRCLDILKNEGKDIARLFLDEKSEHPYVISRCLSLLKKEAYNDAKYLILTSKDINVICQCFNILKGDAVTEAFQLLDETTSFEVQCKCLDILKNKAEKKAELLLKRNNLHPFVICRCLDILGGSAKDESKNLLKHSKSHEVLCKVIRILGDDAKDFANKNLTLEAIHPYVKIACLDILDSEKSKVFAKILVRNHNNHPYLLCKCLDILNEEGVDDAKKLIKIRESHQLVCKCLEVLGEEAYDDAKDLIADDQVHPFVASKCLPILGIDGVDFAKSKLNNWKNENSTLIVSCLKTAQDSEEAGIVSNEILENWDKSIPAMLRMSALRIPIENSLRKKRAEIILKNWQIQFRPLVTAAISVFNDQPDYVKGVCLSILERYKAEIFYQIKNKKYRYDGHLIKSLLNPEIRKETEIIAKEMIEFDHKENNFLGDNLLEIANCITEGFLPTWDANNFEN